MTRHQCFDVRVAPEVTEVLRDRKAPVALSRQFRHAMRLLERYGTRATGAKKFADLDLWEIRLGDHRAYFCPVGRRRAIAVGAIQVKKTKRHKPTELRTMETKVHRWRAVVEEELR